MSKYEDNPIRNKNKGDSVTNTPVTETLCGDIGDKKCDKQGGPYSYFRPSSLFV
jgi:hypothetical protein